MNTPRTPRLDGRRIRWENHNAERRQRVIAAAVDLIDDLPPGSDIHVKEIAERAKMNRSVLYRYFDDRGDLDLAVHREICARIGEMLWPALDPKGTPRAIVNRIVAAHVSWAVAHPGQMRYVERDLPGVDIKPLDHAIEQVAAQVEMIISAFVEAVGAELDQPDRDGLEPWVFGMIGGCFSAVRRWTNRVPLSPSVEAFAEQTSNSVWSQIDGMARLRNISVPDVPVEELLNALESTDPA